MSTTQQAELLFARLCIQSSSIGEFLVSITLYYLCFSTPALIWYDYTLTFPKEVKYIWGQSFRVSTVFYFLCRYSLPVNVLYLFRLLDKLGDPKVVNKIFIAADLASVLARAAIVATFTMRTYAVWGRKPIILVILGSIAIACVAVDITDLRGITYANPDTPLLIAKLLGYLMVIFEAIASILTIIRAWQATRTKGAKSEEDRLADLLLRQGILYFLIMIVLTSAALAVNYIGQGFWQRLLSAFILPVSGMLTARFLLSLREWESKNNAQARTAELPKSEIEFQVNGATSVFSIHDFGEDMVEERRTGKAREII